MTAWLFVYGSLVSPRSAGTSLRRVLRDADGPVPALLNGFRRSWNVGSDRRSHPERALAWSDGRPFAGTLAVLGLERDAGAWCNGALYRLTCADLDALSTRERNYALEAVPVTLADGRATRQEAAVAYLPRPEALDRLVEARRAGSAVVRRDYAFSVRRAFARLGASHLADYLATTTPHGLPVRAIRQVGA